MGLVSASGVPTGLLNPDGSAGLAIHFITSTLNLWNPQLKRTALPR